MLGIAHPRLSHPLIAARIPAAGLQPTPLEAATQRWIGMLYGLVAVLLSAASTAPPHTIRVFHLGLSGGYLAGVVALASHGYDLD